MKYIKFALVSAFILALVLVCGFKIHNNNTRLEEWHNTAVVKTICINPNDTLDDIGYEYKPSWMDVREYRWYIQQLNDLDGSMLYAGQTLDVYVEASQYTAQGLCLGDCIITTDGNEWDYSTDINGCVNIIFNDNGTAENIYDDIIVEINPIG